jgi:hypothetical protein
MPRHRFERWPLLLLCCLGLAALSALAPTVASDEPTRRTHFYSVESRRPVKGSDSLSTISVTFYVKVTPAHAETMLRSQIDFMLTTGMVDTDIMATAWLAKSDDRADKDEISLPDGSDCVFYSKKLKRVMLWKEYQAETSKAPDGAKLLQVSLDTKLVSVGKGEVVVEGTTNLPTGTKLSVGIRNESSGYFMDAQATVANGTFRSNTIRENKASGKKLVNGTYTVDVVLVLPDLQPKEVQQVIGKNGELLTGPLIEVGNFGKSITYAKRLELRQ